jgi:hypothetical protein
VETPVEDDELAAATELGAVGDSLHAVVRSAAAAMNVTIGALNEPIRVAMTSELQPCDV